MHSTDSGVCMDMFTKNIFPREVTGKRCAKFAHAFESKYISTCKSWIYSCEAVLKVVSDISVSYLSRCREWLLLIHERHWHSPSFDKIYAVISNCCRLLSNFISSICSYDSITVINWYLSRTHSQKYDHDDTTSGHPYLYYYVIIQSAAQIIALNSSK